MAISLSDETSLLESFAASHSPEIREQIVLQSVPLVHYLLGRMGITRENGMDYEDLVHQGLLGLIDAVDRFDLKLGTRFSTYASIRIRGKVLDFLRSNDWMSRATRRRIRVVQSAMNTLWDEKRREPTDEELASYLNTDLEEVQLGLLDANRHIVSLDMLSEGNDEEGTSFYEIQADENQVDPLDLSLESDLKFQIATLIKSLPEREQLVLSLYYFEELTFKDIGKVLQLSESRVCQLHSRAITHMKNRLNDE